MKKYSEIEEQSNQLDKPRFDMPRTRRRVTHHPVKTTPKLKVFASVFHETKQESYYRVRYRTVDGASRKYLIGERYFTSQRTP